MDDRLKNILCCDYQKKLIFKFAQTKYFNESNLHEEDNNNHNVKQSNTFSNMQDLISDDEDIDYDRYIKIRNNKKFVDINNNNNFGQSLLVDNAATFKDDRFNFRFKNCIELELTSDDLTELRVDAVVNLTKFDLSHSVYDS
jgi:hypothetical protein